MNQGEHLTDYQLSDYLNNPSLAGEAKHYVGRHLLECDFCLKRLPPPTTGQFWTALMTDEFEGEKPEEGSRSAARLEAVWQSWRQPKILTLGAAALAVLLLSTAFLWLGAARFSQGNEVTGYFDPEVQLVSARTDDEQMNPPAARPAEKTGDPGSPAKANSPAATGNTAASQKAAANKAPKSSLKKASQSDLSETAGAKKANLAKTIVSATRGGATALPVCGGEVETRAGTDGGAVTLKWKKIPKAAKYHLYISDEEEILIDEYETERETSYVVQKPLSSEKTYQWKIVVTLESGKTRAGDARKFTIKDLESNQKKSGRAENNSVRCSESNLNR